MIEVPKVAIFTVYKQNQQGSGSSHIYSEIVLLDKSLSPTHPLLYQLHVDALAIANSPFFCTSGPPSLQRHAELITGEVSSIDRLKKEIVLSDMSTVRYKYLIVINGELNGAYYSHDKDVALAAALATLQDALKIQSHLVTCLPSQPVKEKSSVKMPIHTPHLMAEDSVKRLQELLNKSQSDSLQKGVFHPRRLSEVQT